MTETKKKSRYNDAQRQWSYNYKKKASHNISITLSKIYEADLIEIYKSIPDKAGWFKNCLREYENKKKCQK